MIQREGRGEKGKQPVASHGGALRGPAGAQKAKPPRKQNTSRFAREDF